MGTHLHVIHLRIALLVCDIPLPVVVQQYGDYVTLFKNLLAVAAERYSTKTLPVELDITPFDVVQDQYPPEPAAFDAYVLTGSKYSAYEELSWITRLKEFVKDVDCKTDAKFLGICFGHQIIAEALGGKVTKNPAGWEFGWTEVQINSNGAATLQTAKRTMRIQQMHQDHVSIPPAGFEVIAATDKCPVQAMNKGTRYLTIQGHPEFIPGVVTEIVKARRASKVFAEDIADAVLAQVGNPVDDIWFGEKMIGFLVGTPARE